MKLINGGKKQTQDARSNFCEIFAKTTDNPVEETLNLIKNFNREFVKKIFIIKIC